MKGGGGGDGYAAATFCRRKLFSDTGVRGRVKGCDKKLRGGVDFIRA